MLKVLAEAIRGQGGDPGELSRLREAKALLNRYRELRASLGFEEHQSEGNQAARKMARRLSRRQEEGSLR